MKSLQQKRKLTWRMFWSILIITLLLLLISILLLKVTDVGDSEALKSLPAWGNNFSREHLFILYGFQMVSLSDQPLWKRCVWLCNISPTCELASSSLPSVPSSTAFSLSFSTPKSSPRSNNETFIPKVTWADDGRCYPIHSQVIVYDRQMENFYQIKCQSCLNLW